MNQCETKEFGLNAQENNLVVRRFDVEEACVQALILEGQRIDHSTHQGASPEYGRYVVVDIGTGGLTVISDR